MENIYENRKQKGDQDMSDFLGLKKVENELNKVLDFNIFPKEKKFPQSKAKYTYQMQRQKRNTSNADNIKKIAKGTSRSINQIIQRVKNREIIKLEKQAVNAQQKASALAHKIKTIQAKQDALLDIARYEKELERLENEEN